MLKALYSGFNAQIYQAIFTTANIYNIRIKEIKTKAPAILGLIIKYSGFTTRLNSQAINKNSQRIIGNIYRHTDNKISGIKLYAGFLSFSGLVI